MANPTLTVTPEIAKEDGKNRIAKTAGQAGVAGAVVVVGEWIAHQVGWHGNLPTEVSVSLQLLLTSAGAWLSNLGKLRGQV